VIATQFTQRDRFQARGSTKKRTMKSQKAGWTSCTTMKFNALKCIGTEEKMGWGYRSSAILRPDWIKLVDQLNLAIPSKDTRTGNFHVTC
jgi:hypothetical protein